MNNKQKVNLNCDLGESFSIYKLTEDEEILPYITEANVACGFHASDPNVMNTTVALAKKYNVKVGAHFSLPDMAGFGRREMVIEREEMANIISYQVGALKGFLDMANIKLNHLKPHGALYGMTAKYEHIAHAVADVAEFYRVPIFGLSGTCQEEIYKQRKLDFRSEFFADLEYSDEGELIITRQHSKIDAKLVAKKCLLAIEKGVTLSVSGKEIPVRFSTICFHSDTPNVKEVAKTVHQEISKYLH